MIAIANDITHNSGAFGPREDAVFRAATELALAERLPLVYLAANSGARVGLASEVKACLQACARPRHRAQAAAGHALLSNPAHAARLLGAWRGMACA